MPSDSPQITNPGCRTRWSRFFKPRLGIGHKYLAAVDIESGVDNAGRVHGLSNLRVVDASVMPDCVRANTNVTTVVIGERISDLIRGVF